MVIFVLKKGIMTDRDSEVESSSSNRCVSYFCRKTGKGGVYLQTLVPAPSDSTSSPVTACTAIHPLHACTCLND